MIKIKELSGQNFLSIGDDHVALRLAEQGLIALRGINHDAEKPQSNRAGKSAVSVDLLMFALFGVCARGRTAGRRNGLSADDVINTRTGKGMMTRVLFGADGHDWTIERYRKYPKLGTVAALLGCDGRDVTSEYPDVQAKINSLLGLDYEGALNMLALDQDHVRSFASMTDKEQKAIFESILDLSVWTKAHAHAEGQIKTLLAKMDRTEREYDSLIQRREIIQVDVRDLLAKDESYLTERAEKVKQLRSEQHAASDALTRTVRELEVKQDDLRVEKGVLSECCELAWTAEAVNAKGMDIAGRVADKSAQLDELKRSMRSKTEQINRFQNLKIGDGCPTCGGVIREANVSGLVEPLEREFKELGAELEQQMARRADLQSEHTQNERAKEPVHKRLSELEPVLDEFKAIGRKVSELEHERQRQKRALADMHERAVAAENEPSPYQALIDEKTAAIEKTANLIKSIEARGRRLTLQAADLEFWVKGFGNGGIKSMLLAKVTGGLNQKANEYARELFGDTIKIEFETQAELKSGEMRERFQVNVKNPAGAPLYLAHSSGERRGVDLCIALALNHAMRNRAAEPVDLLMLDEPFENLDSASSHRMGALLTRLQNEIGTVLITSHRFDGNEGNGAVKVWTVEKRGGVSRLTTDGTCEER